MHQAHNVEVTQPLQQSASDDTRCTGQQNGAPFGAWPSADALRSGDVFRKAADDHFSPLPRSPGRRWRRRRSDHGGGCFLVLTEPMVAAAPAAAVALSAVPAACGVSRRVTLVDENG